LEADNHEVSNESLTSMDRNNHFWSATTIMECNNRVVACIDMVNALQRTWSMHSKGQQDPSHSIGHKCPPTGWTKKWIVDCLRDMEWERLKR